MGMPFAVVNDVQLYYELREAHSTDAPTVVFINGIFQDTTSWALTVRDVASAFRTLVYDCRGQGQSDKPQAGPYTPELHARDLAALLDALQIERAHFVGLSNGGLVLMHFARLCPSRLHRLVLVDTFSHLDVVQQAMLHSWRAALEAGGSALRFTVSLPWTWSADFLAQNYDTIMALREKAAQAPTHSSIHLVDGALTHDARAWLGDIRAPTLVVQGTEDKMLSIEKAHALQQAIPNAQLHLIAGAGHAAWLEKAAEFNQVLLEFLKREE
jgi:3-oxoadipate enol-lactonase